jgi:hypothetical protein
MSNKLYIKTEKGDIMTFSKSQMSGYQARMRTSMIRLLSWNLAWLVSSAFMKFGPKFLWHQAVLFTLLAIGLNVCVGIGLILANKKYIEALDELQRKIYLNALAFTVGVALIIGVPYSVMEMYNVLPFHAYIWHLLMLMALTFCVSILHGTWRYR